MLTYSPHRKHPWNQLYKEQVLDHNASSSLLTDNFQLGQHKRSNILYVQEVLVTWAKDFLDKQSARLSGGILCDGNKH